jgi:hypothetical protein
LNKACFERVTDEVMSCLKRRLFTINYYSVDVEQQRNLGAELGHT